MIKSQALMKHILRGIGIIAQDWLSYPVAVIAVFGLGSLYYWLLLRVTSVSNMIDMMRAGEFGAYSQAYFGVYWITTLLTIALFGVAAALLVWLWRRSLLSKGGLGAGGLGGLVGAFAAACPMCGAFLFSLLGVAGGLSLFPLQGLELKFLSLVLMAGSVAFAAQRVAKASACKECVTETGSETQCTLTDAHTPEAKAHPLKTLTPIKLITGILIVLFLVNQFYINAAASALGLQTGNIVQLLGIHPAAVKIIIAPLLNSDGKTTSLVEQPTITELPGNPNSGDPVADARLVMIPKGKPFYAPDDISFDNPINAQDKWGTYENSITLPEDLQKRYTELTNSFTCNYCCGSPGSVTVIARCGCKHAKAWRGFFKYMLKTYGATYSNEQLKGEAYRWTGIWYPKGVLEDYLLATGKGSALPHEAHGGAGTDGMHGWSVKGK